MKNHTNVDDIIKQLKNNQEKNVKVFDIVFAFLRQTVNPPDEKVFNKIQNLALQYPHFSNKQRQRIKSCKRIKTITNETENIHVIMNELKISLDELKTDVKEIKAVLSKLCTLDDILSYKTAIMEIKHETDEMKFGASLNAGTITSGVVDETITSSVEEFVII
jgi:hypothetical protein